MSELEEKEQEGVSEAPICQQSFDEVKGTDGHGDTSKGIGDKERGPGALGWTNHEATASRQAKETKGSDEPILVVHAQAKVVEGSTELDHDLKEKRLEGDARKPEERHSVPETDFSPMDGWKKDALVNLEQTFKVNLSLTDLISRLERQAGGFMTETDRMSVEAKVGRLDRVGRIIEILKKKGNRDYDSFLEILRQSGNEIWASVLEKKANQFKQKYSEQDTLMRPQMREPTQLLQPKPMEGSAEPHMKEERSDNDNVGQLKLGLPNQAKCVPAMDKWNRDALLIYKHELEEQLNLVDLLPQLQQVTVGFMTPNERMSVENESGQKEQVGKFFEILEGKDNKAFGAFLDLLNASSNDVLASKIKGEAQQRRSQCTDPHVQVLEDNAETFLKVMKSASLALELEATRLIPEGVMSEILHAPSTSASNSYLLNFLKNGASQKQVLSILEYASEQTAFGNMSIFASRILTEIHQGSRQSEEDSEVPTRRCSASMPAKVHQQNLVASDPCVSQSDSENTAPSCPNACRCISIVLLIVLAGTLTPFCIPSNLPWPFTSIWIHDVFLNGLPMLWFKDNRDLSTVTVSQDSTSIQASILATPWPLPPNQRHNQSKHSPQQTTIVNLPPMPIELQVISSTLLNGNIYITGIATDKEPGSSQVQVYSLNDSRWSVLPKAPNYNARIAVINGRIALIRGSEEGIKLTNVVSNWFEDENKWKQIVPKMPTGQLASGVCYHDDLLLVSGGVEESTSRGRPFRVRDTVYVYNTKTGEKWSIPQALQLPKPLRSHDLVLCGEYVYLTGGSTTFPTRFEDGKKHFNSEAWRAKWSDVREAVQLATAMQQPQPVRNVWSRIADPPNVRSTAISCNNSLLLVGGLKGGSPQRAIYKFVYEKVDKPWIEVGSMSVGRYRHAAVPLGNCGAVLFVAGGFVEGNSLQDDHELYRMSTSAELVIL